MNAVGGGRLRLRATLVVGVAGLVAALPTSTASAGSVTVMLSPVSPTPIGQGTRFEFRVDVQNGGASTATATIVQRLTETSGGAFVDVRQDQVTVAAGATKSFTREVVTSQWFAATGTFQLTPLVGGSPAGSSMQFEVGPPSVVVPIFEDATAAAGLATPGSTYVCESEIAAGAAWGDVDGDGDLDLYLPMAPGPAKLFINDGAGHFTDQAAQSGATNAGSAGRGAVMADYDNDGDQDLYVLNSGPNALYRNDGDGTFTDVTAAAAVGDPGFSTSAAWGDYDADAYLDLYVTDYGSCTEPGEITYEYDRLYHNEGDGTFTDQTALIEHDPAVTEDGSTIGFGFQGAWWDYDKDGDVDLYLATDYHGGLSPDINHLWRNDGPGEGGVWQFTDVSAASGADLAIASMGIGIADVEADGDLDMAISNIAGNRLLRNDADGTFTEVASSLGVARPYVSAGQLSVTWGLAFNDFNLDGREDLYVAAGEISFEVDYDGPQPNQVFVNKGPGGFLDLSAPSGADTAAPSRGIALADHDRDGRMDIYVINQDGEPMLYRNVTPTAYHWLEIDTVGRASNRDGCGATLAFRIGAASRVRQVFCGSVGFASGSDPTVHVGLGHVTKVDRIVVKWPSGKRQVLRNVPADRMITVIEPAG